MYVDSRFSGDIKLLPSPSLRDPSARIGSVRRIETGELVPESASLNDTDSAAKSPRPSLHDADSSASSTRAASRSSDNGIDENNSKETLKSQFNNQTSPQLGSDSSDASEMNGVQVVEANGALHKLSTIAAASSSETGLASINGIAEGLSDEHSATRIESAIGAPMATSAHSTAEPLGPNHSASTRSLADSGSARESHGSRGVRSSTMGSHSRESNGRNQSKHGPVTHEPVQQVSMSREASNAATIGARVKTIGTLRCAQEERHRLGKLVIQYGMLFKVNTNLE